MAEGKNRGADCSRKPIQKVGNAGRRELAGGDLTPFAKDIVDTLRVLAQAQEHLTSEDISLFFRFYEGPPEGAELMLLQDVISETPSHNMDQPQEFTPLAGAVHELARSPDWEPVVRRLLRSGADPSLQLSHPSSFVGQAGDLLSNGDEGAKVCSPLDYLFGRVSSPFDSSIVSSRWLRALASEGIDVSSYLAKEKSLHGPDCQLSLGSCSCGLCLPRQLYFELNKPCPMVYWDWWIDPESIDYPLLTEFKYLNFCNRTPWSSMPWQEMWPFQAPLDYDNQGYPHSSLHVQKFSKRYARRRNEKARQVSEKRKPQQMPGSWLD